MDPFGGKKSNLATPSPIAPQGSNYLKLRTPVPDAWVMRLPGQPLHISHLCCLPEPSWHLTLPETVF